MDDSSEPKKKKKRNLPGTPDPEAEVIALSPRTLMATNRFSCDVCGKGFQRDQNLQLHRRGHNLPWKLKQREGQEIKKKVYVCPEILCVHHDPSRALGDLTGIKKHFSRKHGEKKWKCEKCSKSYAVQSDWKAHKKVCGTREYRCDCGTLFSRRDSFTTHRAFCGALAEENAKSTSHKKVDSQESDNCSDENTPPSGRTRELSSTFNAPSTPSQLTCSPSTVEVGEPPIKESSTTPSVKEGFKQVSTNENLKQCPIKQNLEPGSVEEIFKQSPLKEVLEEPLCTLEESGISSVSPKCIQDGREAHSHKTNEVMNIRRLGAELDDIGTSTMSPKWQQNVEDRSNQVINSGFKHCNNPLDGKGVPSSSPKWVEDSVAQNYKPIRNFKLPDSSLDINKMTSLSVPPKWMQNAINEQAYKPSGGSGEPNYGSNEGQIPSVSPNWIHDGIQQMEKPNKGPTPLSLSLGCGPSPGISSKFYGAKPFEEMNDVATALYLQNEHRNQFPSLSHDSDTFTRMLTSSNNSATNNTDSSEPQHTIYYRGLLRNNGAGETLAYGNTIGSQSYLCGNPSKPFNNNHHRYNTTKGQMPATALLQKAAMMGSTSSNRYLLRNFGLIGSNTLSNMVSAGSGKDYWAGSSVSSMCAGGFTAISPTTGANNVDRSSHEGGAYVRASIHDGVKTKVQGSFRASSIDASSLSTNLNNHMDAIHGHDQMLLFGKSKVSNNSTIVAGLEEIQRTDKHGGDKMTLDLLGVGSHGMGVKERTFS